MKKIILLLYLFCCFIISCTSEKGELPVKQETCDSVISYSMDIVPIILAKCSGHACHDATSGNGDYAMYADIKLKADDGQLKNRVIVLKNMPPSGSPLLSDAEISQIRCWIQQGAPNN